MNREQNTGTGRPDFMATLELLPPYTMEDVRKAYQAKARGAHPDAGGNAAEFVGIAEAYQRAIEYVEFRSSPREWVAARVERYIEQSELVAEIQTAGGEVELEDAGWRSRDLGEFGQVGDQIVTVRLGASADVSTCLKLLVTKKQILTKLILIDLGNSKAAESDLELLPAFAQLLRLDLRNTAVSYRGLQILREMKELTMLNLGGTSINLWQRFRLGRRFPQLRIVTQTDTALDARPSPAAVLAGGR